MVVTPPSFLHITLGSTGLILPGLICPCVYAVFQEIKGISDVKGLMASLPLLCLESHTQLQKKQRV